MPGKHLLGFGSGMADFAVFLPVQLSAEAKMPEAAKIWQAEPECLLYIRK
jgi:hypothetical protein